ncbi:hypothetical protein QAD02_010586 [Eretmocerus hayati]|uniref:Uncharacterized protein n=1 Tax=Eretmocerus hayati TaxID=131215 RepID=A0ACC2NU71_9HYME|nr:hypothetical protein QAD02_010586 [Eretmocerus hayati]
MATKTTQDSPNTDTDLDKTISEDHMEIVDISAEDKTNTAGGSQESRQTLFLAPGSFPPLGAERQRTNSTSSQHSSRASSSDSRPTTKRKKTSDDITKSSDFVRSAVDAYYDAEADLHEYIKECQEKKKYFTKENTASIISHLTALNKAFITLAVEAGKARTSELYLEKQCAKLEKQQAQQRPQVLRTPTTPLTPTNGSGFAAALKAPPPPRPKRGRNQQPQKRFTAFVKPVENAEAGPPAPVETKKAFMTELDKLTASSNLTDKGLTVSIKALKKPKIIVYDVDRDLSEADFKDMLFERNEELFGGITKTDLANNIAGRLKGKTAANKEVFNWIVEVTPDIRNRLIRAGRIYLGYASCRLNDHISVPTCYKCQAYNHVSKYCEANADTCMHCA